jgi:hypothetical protein
VATVAPSPFLTGKKPPSPFLIFSGKFTKFAGAEN